MKKIWMYSIVALAGLSLLACNKEMDEPSASSGYTYLITIDEGSKLYLDGDHMAWEAYDGIGWYVSTGYGYCYPGSSSINLTTPRSFSITCPGAIGYGGRIYACAPYSDIDGDGTATLFIPFEQYGDIQDAMPMVSLPIEVSASIPAYTTTPVGVAKFINLGAVIQYNVFTSDPSYSAELVQSVTFTAETAIAGDFNVNLTAVSETSIPAPSSLSEKSVTSFPSYFEMVGSSKADGLKVYQVVAPGTLSGTVTVTTDAATYSYPVSNIVFDRATIKTLNVDLASANATRRTLEDYGTLLTAHEWQLVSVVDYEGTEVTQNAGDLLTLNADYSLSVTCNTLEDNVYDYMNNEWVDFRLGYESWDDVPREWSMSYFYGAYPVLDFTDFAYPLAIVTDNTYWQSYYIVSLTDTELVLQYGNPCIYTITFTNPAGPAPSTPEALLTAHEWELTSVLRRYPEWETEYTDVTETAGNKMTLNANHSFTFDCDANGGYVYDYSNGWGEIHSDLREWGSPWDDSSTVLEWSVSESGGTNYLNFTECAYPLVIVDEIMMCAQSYEIAVLTDSCLELHHSTTYCDYIITFAIPGEKSRIESLLTAHDWELSAVTRAGEDVTRTAGNIMTLNADHSYSFDCGSNVDWPDYVYDYVWDAYTKPYFSPYTTYEWSVSFGNVTSLVFSKYGYPLVIVGDNENYALPYEIVTLTDNSLVLAYDTYRISFTPAS